MAKDYDAPPGVFDLLPSDPKEPWRSSYLWSHSESIMRNVAKNFGFAEIRTPIFEKTELFSRSVGEETDIVSKEMYSFVDRGGRNLSLRPEGTAPVIRAVVEHHLQHAEPLQKLFYIGPMFRYERMQAGRYRQFHQFGAEALGVRSPEQDVEMIDMAMTLFASLGLKNLSLQISSLGGKKTREAFREALKNHLKGSFDALSETSRRRFETNPLRILDSKDPQDQLALKGCPSILDLLEDDSKEHFIRVQELLNKLQIPYTINKNIVRGLDYYNDTVFEIISGELGSQNSVGGGGRYDTMIEELGGKSSPAIGFAAGIERIFQVLISQNSTLPKAPAPLLYLIPLGERAKLECFELMAFLRKQSLPVDMDLSSKKLGKAMQRANQINASFVAVVGDQELETGKIALKEMETGKGAEVPLKSLPRILEILSKQKETETIIEELLRPFDTAEEAKFFINKIGGSVEETTHLIESLKKAVAQMKEIS